MTDDPLTNDPFKDVARRKYSDLNAYYDMIDVMADPKREGKATLSHLLALRRALGLDRAAAAEVAPQKIGPDQLQALIAGVMQDD